MRIEPLILFPDELLAYLCCFNPFYHEGEWRYSPFFLASFQIASISSRDISFEVFPFFNRMFLQVVETADELLIG